MHDDDKNFVCQSYWKFALQKHFKKNLGSNLRPGCGVDPTNRQKKNEKTKQTMTHVIPALIVDYHNSMVNNEYFFFQGCMVHPLLS